MWYNVLPITCSLLIFTTCSHLIFTVSAAASSNALPSDSSNPTPFSPGFDIGAVISLAKSLPSHSWEFGTASEALLELYDPHHAVFGANPFPVPTIPPSQSVSLNYAQQKIVIGPGANGLNNGNGAVGDPASLGVSAVLLGKTDNKYFDAAKGEIEYILGQAPRWWNGAISHRAQYAELWADFIYMAPPFLAYYGAATNNASVLRESVEQCRLYRQVLLANTTSGPYTPPVSHPDVASGLWVHIVGPVSADPGIWSTGNAWAAAGMTRVLATVLKAPSHLYQDQPTSASDLAVSWKNQAVNDLTTFICEILEAAMLMPMDDGLLLNYLDDTQWFGETSGTALLASVAYRLSVLAPSLHIEPAVVDNYVQWAEDIRSVFGQGHITSNGTATPAVNPLGWGDKKPWTAGSPEGQNFVVMMYAAWRDCVVAKVKGCNA
ncbi:hypothetical protein BYT27DRAFT_6852588 [Phlegmacium glaucopus]|nr:hypothetical protein BYT27DRAFT_6852588 [Phlegmacium glaucopus]